MNINEMFPKTGAPIDPIEQKNTMNNLNKLANSDGVIPTPRELKTAKLKLKNMVIVFDALTPYGTQMIDLTSKIGHHVHAIVPTPSLCFANPIHKIKHLLDSATFHVGRITDYKTVKRLIEDIDRETPKYEHIEIYSDRYYKCIADAIYSLPTHMRQNARYFHIEKPKTRNI